jgi:ubiquinone/menaquinone biosynthesis C-methylase UbiE
MTKEQSFFDFAAEVGLTKHLGGLDATQELLELCQIKPGAHLLDVGCGAGATPAYIAKKHDCSVVGVDISDKMILQSEQLAQRKGVADRLEFRVADVQDLPFEDETFDAVISESVTAFPEDKPLTSAEWVALLETAELEEIITKSYKVNVQNETKGIFRRYGFGGMLRVLSRTFKLYARNPAYRQFVKDVRQDGVTPKNLDEYFGYGLYVGRKPASEPSV